MIKQIVVFGGSGFIGRHLIECLLTEEGCSVISVDVRPPKVIHPGVNYIQKDVRDLADLEIKEPVQRVYNLAAVHTTPGHPENEYYETNIAGAAEITTWATRNGVSEIIFTSSISVYGPGEDRKVETTPLEPKSAYGRSKRLAEQIHRHWQEQAQGRKLTIVRPSVVFGAGENGNFTRLARLLRSGFFVYPGRRDTIKACISVKDLLDAIEFARMSHDGIAVLNGAYPEPYSLEDIVTVFIQDHFPKARTLTVPGPMVTAAAHLLVAGNVFGLGIHPERVTKLVRSTNVYPGWLVEHRFEFQGGLREALARWASETEGRFD